MRTHKFFKSHATHYNTISNGVKPLDAEIQKELTPKGWKKKGFYRFPRKYRIEYHWYLKMIELQLLSPFQG